MIMLNHDFITPRVMICIKGLGNEVYSKHNIFTFLKLMTHVVSE